MNAPAADESLADWLAEPGHRRIARGDADFPALLAAIADPPAELFVVGDASALHLPCLAIVGSRNPTKGGMQNAFEFARFLGRNGFCIVSGLAAGIDAAAHRGALAAGAKTVAFLGHGIDTVYPAANRELASEIAAHGALVSEFPLGTPPMRPLFPQRNRLISGLALGTLVVEAARHSGSLITARLAAEQGREVFALPGSIHNPMARGCHRLIRDGAKLVESGEDIVAELGALAGRVLQFADEAPETPSARAAGEDDDYRRLRDNLAHDPVTVNDLASRSGLTIDQVSSMLLILELDGIVEKLSGGRYALLR
ncbi:MAG TPA: DNA-processing protein DprA [Woeseiaceae bacterium]|nr:DNA-processing protein DprA [Woeseiaceae bacterium]